MLAKLKRETQGQQVAADDGRLEPLRSTSTQASYTSYLARIYGFESPIETAFLASRELGKLVDLRWRSQVRLLKCDLAALGIIDATRLPVTPAPPFGSVTDAFGWMYVVEQSAVLHGQLRRHFARWLPQQVATAGCYLLGGERAVGKRLCELGTALDAYAASPDIATKIVDAARAGFRRQRLWFGQSLPPRVSSQVAR
jgi:heme oxygenase